MKENLAALQKAFINLATERSQLMHYIEVENLTFYYDDEPVLEDVSYYVDPGEFVILTGENGAAKSTLIKSTLGLLKPTSGKITVAKKIVLVKNQHWLHSTTSRFFQCGLS